MEYDDLILENAELKRTCDELRERLEAKNMLLDEALIVINKILVQLG